MQLCLDLVIKTNALLLGLGTRCQDLCTGTLVCGRAENAYQCSRASHGFLDSQDLLQREKSLKHSDLNRQQCQLGGLSTEASRLLSASWSSKTTSSYASLSKWWDSYCKESARGPIKSPIGDVVNFLAGLFQAGYQYAYVDH